MYLQIQSTSNQSSPPLLSPLLTHPSTHPKPSIASRAFIFYINTNYCTMPPPPPPKYLTGDNKAIKEFIDRFDVSKVALCIFLLNLFYIGIFVKFMGGEEKKSRARSHSESFERIQKPQGISLGLFHSLLSCHPFHPFHPLSIPLFPPLFLPPPPPSSPLPQSFSFSLFFSFSFF